MRNSVGLPGHSYSYIDDLKFYNASLTLFEIYAAMYYEEPVAEEVSTDMSTDMTTSSTSTLVSTSTTSTRNTL